MKYLYIILIASIPLILLSHCKKENNLDDVENLDDVIYCDSTELTVQLVTDECADSVYYLNGQTERNYLTVYTSQFTMYFTKTTTAQDINDLLSKYNILELDTIMENYSEDLVCSRGNLQDGLDCNSMISKLDSIENEIPVKFTNPYLALSEDTRISFTNKYRVKLLDLKDTTELKCLADLLNSTIIGEVPYTTHQFQLELKDNSSYSTFEIFNYLDNTEFFEYVSPGYWMIMPGP